MKFLTLIFLLSSFSAFADDMCDRYFVQGKEYFSIADQHFDTGYSTYRSISASDTIQVACKKAERAKLAFDNAWTNYRRSAAQWQEASGTCDEVNRKIALRNFQSCISNAEQAQKNSVIILNDIYRNCR